MGQAKQRGNFEQRKLVAITLVQAIADKRKADEAAKPKIRVSTTSMLVAGLIAAAMPFHRGE